MGHNGVVVKLAEAGLKTAPRQPEILKALLSAFHVENDAKSCVPLFLTLTAYEVYSEHKEKMEKDKDIKRVSLFFVCWSPAIYMHQFSLCYRELYMSKGL